jgi:hypothetical protein
MRTPSMKPIRIVKAMKRARSTGGMMLSWRRHGRHRHTAAD